MKLLIMGICLAVFILGVWSNASAQGITVRVSVASDGTQGNESLPFISYSNPYISADGRFVTFYSYAYNLVSGDTNGYADVFIHDLLTGLTTLVSLTSEGRRPTGILPILRSPGMGGMWPLRLGQETWHRTIPMAP